jgi:hypothetical protein
MGSWCSTISQQQKDENFRDAELYKGDPRAFSVIMRLNRLTAQLYGIPVSESNKVEFSELNRILQHSRKWIDEHKNIYTWYAFKAFVRLYLYVGDVQTSYANTHNYRTKFSIPCKERLPNALPSTHPIQSTQWCTDVVQCLHELGLSFQNHSIGFHKKFFHVDGHNGHGRLWKEIVLKHEFNDSMTILASVFDWPEFYLSILRHPSMKITRNLLDAAMSKLRDVEYKSDRWFYLLERFRVTMTKTMANKNALTLLHSQFLGDICECARDDRDKWEIILHLDGGFASRIRWCDAFAFDLMKRSSQPQTKDEDVIYGRCRQQRPESLTLYKLSAHNVHVHVCLAGKNRAVFLKWLLRSFNDNRYPCASVVVRSLHDFLWNPLPVIDKNFMF